MNIPTDYMKQVSVVKIAVQNLILSVNLLKRANLSEEPDIDPTEEMSRLMVRTTLLEIIPEQMAVWCLILRNAAYSPDVKDHQLEQIWTKTAKLSRVVGHIQKVRLDLSLGGCDTLHRCRQLLRETHCRPDNL